MILVHSCDVLRGDIIVGWDGAPMWNGRAMVVAARQLETFLSLDLRWLDDGKLVTGCALPADDMLAVERGESDPVIEWARATFATYCARIGLC